MATAEKTTLRSLLVEGLRWALSQRKTPRKFRLEDASVPGKGMQPGIAEGNWEAIRELAYRQDAPTGSEESRPQR